MRDLPDSRRTAVSRCRPSLLFAAAGLVAVTATGQARASRPAPVKPPAKGAQPAKVTLPSWGPKNPSKEFLRAAQVLKPVPEEAQPYSPLYLPAWELFGSLTDQQVKEFLTRQQASQPVADMEKGLADYLKEHEEAKQVGDKLVYYRQSIVIKLPSFSPRQRVILDRLRKAWQEANRGTPEEDLFVMLYKMGAKRDLSNVEISFDVSGRHAVNLNIAAVVPAGPGRQMGFCTGAWVAQI